MIPAAKLQQLRYFVLGAELRSYRAAAERAARSQPAISLAPREPRIQRVLGLITRKGQSLSPAAQSLRRCILQQLEAAAPSLHRPA